MLRSLVKRSSSHFLGLLAGRIVSILVFIFLARVLVPESFGKITLYITLLSLGTLTADFGLNQWYQKTIHLLSKKSHLHSLLSARLITLVASTLIMMGILLWSQSFNFTLSLLLILTLIPEALLSAFDGYYFSQKQPLVVSGKLIIRNVIFGLGLFLVRNNPQLLTLVIIFILTDLITLAWYFPRKVFKNWKFSYQKGIQTLKKSSQYAILIFTSFAYARGDSLIIEYSLGSSFLGIYSSAYRYLEGLSLLPSALAQNLFHISAQKNGVSKSQLKKITFLMLGLGLLVGGIMFFSSDLLTTRLLGEAYASGANLVKVFSLVLVMFFVNSPLSTVVQSSDLFKKFLPWGIANTVTNLFLNLILIPIYGIGAAAWVMLGSEVSGFLINLWWVRKVYSKK